MFEEPGTLLTLAVARTASTDRDFGDADTTPG